MMTALRRLFSVGLVASLVPLTAMAPADAAETIAREAILMDADTGTILLDKDADKSMPPASMSKLMTVYLVFQRLKEGALALDDTFIVSENAWRKGGAKSGSSTMFLLPGEKPTVHDLLRGIIVQSGNDACIVVAESLAGSEEIFADAMTAKGREIGLTGSTFRNATGWPHPEHRMTARDLAVLARRTIIDFPEYYHIYSELEFTHNKVRQRNRNPLLYKGMGADGLKTGHTSEAGYGLVASAKRGDQRLILVVNGLKSRRERSTEPQRLLEWGFRTYRNYALFNAGEQVDVAEVWLGDKGQVPLLIERDVTLTLARNARASLKATVIYDNPLPAPVSKGQEMAKLRITADGMAPLEIPLVAGDDAHRLGFFGRMNSALRFLLLGESG